MKIMNQPKHHKYNCLFIPGLPGKIKGFSCFEDIDATGGQIHWLQFSGTYDNQTGIEFSLESTVSDIEQALQKLSESGLPILIVAYSYSTAVIHQVDLSRFPLLLGLALFSPIRGLDMANINEDFNETISALLASGDISADAAEWHTAISRADHPNFGLILEKLTSYDFPVMMAYSLGDAVIKAGEMSREIDDFRKNTAYNKLLVFAQTDGYHRLDSYYDVKIGNFFRALEIELDLMALLDKDIFVYLWGSALNANYAGEGSDIDLLIFSDGYLEKHQELNTYTTEYNKSHSVPFDLSINNKTDLMTKKIFRYNRGPVAIHELCYAYLPLRSATEIIKLAWEDIVRDAYNASLILCGESKKILCKCDIKSERVKKIVKYSITVFVYLQYIQGIKNLDLNHVERYLDETSPFYACIARSIELKKRNYQGMTMHDLYQAVNGIDMIIREQESLIGITK